MKIANKFAENVIIDAETLAAKYSEEMRAWQGAPSIACTRGGRLFVSFMSGGIYEPDPRNCDLLVYSDDNGDHWSSPVLAIESRPEIRQRISDLELWIAPNGALWMFWHEAPYEAGLSLPTYEQKIDMENDSEYHRLEAQVHTCAAVCEDPDAEELVFGEPRELFPAMMRNHPFAADRGRWIFPTHRTPAAPCYAFRYSDDEGKTFHLAERSGRALRRAFDEPTVYRMADGRIAVIVRTAEPMFKRMISSDNGESWSAPAELFAAASQRPCALNAKRGGVWLTASADRKARNGLRLMYSPDGVDFSEVLLLDDRERVSYAEIAEGEDGTLYIAYDRERNNKIRKSRVAGVSEAAKEILFARIPPEAQTGTVTADTVRARVISKARINELDNHFSRETQ